LIKQACLHLRGLLQALTHFSQVSLIDVEEVEEDEDEASESFGFGLRILTV